MELKMKKDTTYLVMKVHTAYAVLLDNSGRYIKAANKGYQTGDTVRDITPLIYPSDRAENRRKPVWPRAYVWAHSASMNTSICMFPTGRCRCRSILL